jgi:hypothetical protein
MGNYAYLSKKQEAWILKAPKHSSEKIEICKQELQAVEIFIQKQQRWRYHVPDSSMPVAHRLTMSHGFYCKITERNSPEAPT